MRRVMKQVKSKSSKPRPIQPQPDSIPHNARLLGDEIAVLLERIDDLIG
jgi:hypothetical protein